MGAYFQKQAAAERLYKLAACARVVRRKRAIKKCAEGTDPIGASPIYRAMGGPANGQKLKNKKQNPGSELKRNKGQWFFDWLFPQAPTQSVDSNPNAGNKSYRGQ